MKRNAFWKAVTNFFTTHIAEAVRLPTNLLQMNVTRPCYDPKQTGTAPAWEEIGLLTDGRRFGSNPVAHRADKSLEVDISPAIQRSLLARFAVLIRRTNQ
jgi:hypothetical protein